MTKFTRTTGLLVAVALAAGCDGGGTPTGLGEPTANQGGGPVVKFDLFALPLPEVPLPNDLASRPDPNSPTGLRLNASVLAAPTGLEQRTRRKIDQLDGWGVYSAMTVGFEPGDGDTAGNALDLQNILDRHAGDDFDPADDVLYLIDIDPAHRDRADYGQPRAVDLGEGNFPVVLQEPNRYYENDPRGGTSNILFETAEEDLNGNGRLDLGEDTDFDGVFDHPNVLDLASPPPNPAAPMDRTDVVTFYERQTDTLIFRPLVPLESRTRYAVVITKRLRGNNGQPVRSPFPYFHHVDQAGDLADLDSILSSHPEWFGDLRGVEDVAFAWTFTTQSVREDILSLIEGLDEGTGPFARLHEEYPPEANIFKVHECNPYGPGECDLPGNVYIVKSDFLAPILSQVATQVFELSPDEADPLIETYQYVDYFVFGWLTSPQFLDSNGDGWEEESWDINWKTGRGQYTPGRLNFLAIVPKDEYRQQYNERNHKPAGAPAPVVFYGHGYTGFKVEALGFGGNLAKFGLTTVTWECVHHGAGLDAILKDVAMGIFDVENLHGAGLALLDDRAIDMDNDKFSGTGSDPSDNEPAPCLEGRPCFPTMHFDVPFSGYAQEVDALPGGEATGQPNAWLGTYDEESGHWSNVLYQDDIEDSAGDFWTSYVFHTRDVVRQSALDLIRIINYFRSFDGTRRAEFDQDGDGEREPFDFDADGTNDLSGDFDGDGDVDFGGKDNEYYVWGQSLGGIMAGVLGGTHPSIRAVAPVAGGGGLADVGIRSTQGGVKEAVILRMMGPLVVTTPAATRYSATERNNRTACCDPADGVCDPSILSLRFIIPELNSTGEVEIGCLHTDGDDNRTFKEGDVMVVRNMARPEEPRCFVAGPEGRVRISIPSDLHDRLEITTYDGDSVAGYPLLDAATCRLADGLEMRTQGPSEACPTVECEGDGPCPIQLFEVTPGPFMWDDYKQCDPLVAVAEGLGLRRGTPELRRFMGIAQMVLDPGDPAVYAPHYQNSMVISTVGDMNVPVNTGIAIARAAGTLKLGAADRNPAWGDRTSNRVLLDQGVIMGLERLSPEPWGGALFDADDLSNSTDGYGAPTLRTELGQPPVRAWRPSLATESEADGCTVAYGTDGAVERVECDGGVSSLVLPYISRGGDHGFGTPNRGLAFDVNTFMVNMIGVYFGSGGKVLEYDICMHDNSCDFIPPLPFGPDWP